MYTRVYVCVCVNKPQTRAARDKVSVHRLDIRFLLILSCYVSVTSRYVDSLNHAYVSYIYEYICNIQEADCFHGTMDIGMYIYRRKSRGRVGFAKLRFIIECARDESLLS